MQTVLAFADLKDLQPAIDIDFAAACEAPLDYTPSSDVLAPVPWTLISRAAHGDTHAANKV